MNQNLARQLADTVISRYPKAEAYPYRPWSYPQGYLLIGMAKLWRATGEPRYRDYRKRRKERGQEKGVRRRRIGKRRKKRKEKQERKRKRKREKR